MFRRREGGGARGCEGERRGQKGCEEKRRKGEAKMGSEGTAPNLFPTSLPIFGRRSASPTNVSLLTSRRGGVAPPEQEVRELKKEPFYDSFNASNFENAVEATKPAMRSRSEIAVSRFKLGIGHSFRIKFKITERNRPNITE